MILKELEAEMQKHATDLVKLTKKYGMAVDAMFDDSDAPDFSGDDADQAQFILGYFAATSLICNEHERDLVKMYSTVRASKKKSNVTDIKSATRKVAKKK